MRWLLTLTMLLGCVMTVQADSFLYVSMAPEQKIQVFRLNPKDGSLTSVQMLEVKGQPGALVVDPDKKFLYATLRSTSSLASFAIDSDKGTLKYLSTATLPKGQNAAYVATDRTGRWLISASYSGGKIVVHGLKDGMIQSPAVQTITTVPTAHCIATDPGNKFVFVPHVKPNAVYQYHLDVATGKLTESGKAAGGLKNSGPRHLAFHPKVRMAFTSDEVAQTITAYNFDTEKGLTPVQSLSTLPDDYKGKSTTAEVKVHPNGKFVWVSNRGHDSLAGFAIDDMGKLKSIGQTPTEKTPRSFEFSPDGKYLFGAGEGTGKLAIYSVDADSGKLKRIQTLDIGKSLTWVLAVKLK